MKGPGSSAGLHCHHDGCVEALVLERSTAVQPTVEDDYQQLVPALDAAVVSLGWRVYACFWWCPTHVAAKNLACARCMSPCPSCSCTGGPIVDAIEGSPLCQ